MVKKTSLTLQQQLEILKDLESYSVAIVAEKYHVKPKRIRAIRSRAATLAQYAAKYAIQKKSRRMRKPKFEELEERLHTWFLERRSLGDYVSDAMLMRRAAELKEGMPSSSNFKISQGWLANFKKRNGIRLVTMRGEKSSADEDGTKKFIEELRAMLEEKNVAPENLYNMVETGLLWKALPAITLAEKSDRVTVALCANATGSNKITPLVIYKYKNPCALKHCRDSLPVIFKSQRNAWIDRSVFLDWYENVFKASVRSHQLQNGIYGQVVLILDNYEGYGMEEEFDDYFRIVYLPLNTTSRVQPMNQGVVEKVKKAFRRKMMQSVVTYENGITEFYNDYSIKDCLLMIHTAWAEVTVQNVQNAWQRILFGSEENTEGGENRRDRELEEAMGQIMGEECDENKVAEFLFACEEEERRGTLIQEEEEVQTEDEEPHEDAKDTKSIINVEEPTERIEQTLKSLHLLTTSAPPHIQHIVQALRSFYLEENS